MAYTRLDLRNLVRREVQDTGSPPLWSDTQLNDDLQAAFQAYSQYFPYATTAVFSSGADQTALLLGGAVRGVSAVIVDGVTVPQVPDQATLVRARLPQSGLADDRAAGDAVRGRRDAWAGVGLLRSVGQLPLRAGGGPRDHRRLLRLAYACRTMT